MMCKLKGPFIYKVMGGPREFMGCHHKNTFVLGGSEIEILNANRGAKVNNLFVLVYMSERQLP